MENKIENKIDNNHENNDESNIEIEIPDNSYFYDSQTLREIYEYLNSLNNIQKKAYIIAYKHLGSSFNIVKSNGFIEWKNSKKN